MVTIVHIPSAVGLIFAGERVNASDIMPKSMRLMQAAWREVGVSLFALLHTQTHTYLSPRSLHQPH